MQSAHVWILGHVAHWLKKLTVSSLSSVDLCIICPVLRVIMIGRFNRCENARDLSTFAWIFGLHKTSDVFFKKTYPCGRAVEGVGLRPLAWWDRGFESHRGHGCLMWACMLSEVPATGWSLVRRSSAKCEVSLSEIRCCNNLYSYNDCVDRVKLRQKEIFGSKLVIEGDATWNRLQPETTFTGLWLKKQLHHLFQISRHHLSTLHSPRLQKALMSADVRGLMTVRRVISSLFRFSPSFTPPPPPTTPHAHTPTNTTIFFFRNCVLFTPQPICIPVTGKVCYFPLKLRFCSLPHTITVAQNWEENVIYLK